MKAATVVALLLATGASSAAASDRIEFNPANAQMARARIQAQACVQGVVYEMMVGGERSRAQIKQAADGHCSIDLVVVMPRQDRAVYALIEEMTDQAIDQLAATSAPAERPEARGLIASYYRGLDGCAGATNLHTRKAKAACALLKSSGEKLEALGYCYGEDADAGYKARWEPCKHRG